MNEYKQQLLRVQFLSNQKPNRHIHTYIRSEAYQ